MTSFLFSARWAKLGLLALLVSVATLLPLAASTLTTVVKFESTNGASPTSGLVMGSDGAFYGTTTEGGAAGYGTVFKMTPDGLLTTLVSFSGTNGRYPYSGLVEGSDGSFYGTTTGGGSYGNGTVFKITTEGVLTTLISFEGTNGAIPYGGLVEGGDGLFYGTTTWGGTNDSGTVFKISTEGILTSLVSFNETNGSHPYAALVEGSDGLFYGTTTFGGTNDCGTVFKITPDGMLATLMKFNDTNGRNPNATLIESDAGVFYGTTRYGGGGKCGTIFQITPQGVLTTLVSFDHQNGVVPFGTLIEFPDGVLSGTTLFGRTIDDGGTVFQFTLDRQPQTITFPTLPPQANGTSFIPSATASSGLPVTYTVLSGPATVSGTLVTITGGTGRVNLQASQAGNTSYAVANSVTQSFTVTKTPQTVAFPVSANPPYGVPFSPEATASSRLPVAYKVLSGPATVSGNKLVFSGVGNVVVQGTQGGNSNYAAAPAVTASFTVVMKADQSIALAKVPNQVLGAGPVTLQGAASSGLPVTYKVTGPATVSGNVVTITGAGVVGVGAYQTGSARYNAAPIARTSFMVGKLTQKITFPAVGVVSVGQTVTLGATTSSGLPIIYTSTGPVTLSGNVATFTGTGSVKFTANQPGDGTYSKALAVSVNASAR